MATVLGWIKSKIKKNKSSNLAQHLWVDRLTYEVIKSNDSFIIEAVGVDPIYVETNYKKQIHYMTK